MELIGFLVAVIVTAIDPFRLLGSVLAGSLIRRQGLAIAIGVLWNLMILVASASLNRRTAGPDISLEYMVASMISTFAVTTAANAIATSRRAKRATPPAPPEEKGG